jgi:LPS export ABC transporter protein LptC
MYSGRVLGLLAAGLCVFFVSCSFNYDTDAGSGESIPDMVITDAAASRYEKNALSVVLSARLLEIYNTDSVWAGDTVSFTQYSGDGSGTVEAEGQAGLFLVDQKEDVYSLGDSVSFRYIPDELRLSADDLQWQKKTHWLSAPSNGVVSIKKDDGSEIRGTGFFADTLSRKYEIIRNVAGQLDSGQDSKQTGDTDAE